jgi:hypothetical protein
MMCRWWMSGLFVAAAMMLSAVSAHAESESAQSTTDPFGKRASLHAPAVEQVRQQLAAWLETLEVDDALRAQALGPWTGDPAVAEATELLKRLADSLALVDPKIRELVEFCSQPKQSVTAPEFAWLAHDERPPLARNNLRLLLGRWLAQQRMYDEALTQIAELTPEQVVDPATLLFYQSVCHHRLLNAEPGLKTIRRLLDDVDQQPQRYVALATLMYDDLQALKEDSLDHISRRMDDIGRRLDLGRAGPKVRKVEDDVIASLDKLIEEMEKQRQQQQASSGGGGQNRSASPAQDSRILGGRGAGDVDRKPIGSKSGWGDLPPKQRQEALQQIGKDFPSHYREVIEQYFRKLAGEEDAK